MELDELAQRLAMLENGAAEQQAAAIQSQFMDKYGTRFSGDEGIGVAILGELGRRGIDTSAADEAVQQILDQIRMEATAVLDKIKADQSTVADLVDKVNIVSDSVTAATGAAPDVGGPPPPVETPPVGELPPPEAPVEEVPPPAASVEEVVPPPVVEEAPPPEEVIPPAGVPSDIRVKNLRNKVLTHKTTRVKTWTPSKGVLDSIRGGM